MSWLFGNRNPPQAPAGFPPAPQPPPPGGSDGGDKNKRDSRMEYSFDSSALERAAKAAKELENSKHAKDALLLIQEQERLKAIEAQKQMKEYETQIEQIKLEQLRAAAEERRKMMAEETKQHQYKAQYDDQLARKRYEDQLAQQARMNEENLRKQEESVKKQEAMRIASMEKEAELRHKNDMLRIEAEMRGKAKIERENWDLTKEQIKLRAAEERKTKLESITTYSQVLGLGMSTFLNNRNMITAFAGGVTLIVGGYYGVKHSFGLVFRVIESRIGKPALVRETSRFTIGELFKSPFTTLGRFIKRPEDPMKGVILKPSLEERLRDIAIETRHTKKNRGYFRNILMHGPPGTGKTMFAKRLAKHSGMDYAILTGGDIAPMGKDAATAMYKVFDWAHTSRKGVVLFIDEADAFLRRRGNESVGEDFRSAVNAFLFKTGEQSNKFMLVLASNLPEQFDRAINNRLDDMVEFEIPGYEERERLVRHYFQKFILEPAASKASRLRVADFDYGKKCAEIAQRTEGLSGREISKMGVAWQNRAYVSEDGVLTEEMIDRVVNLAMADHKKKVEWEQEPSRVTPISATPISTAPAVNVTVRLGRHLPRRNRQEKIKEHDDHAA
ncbi:hypothetical protein BsWGS_26233 [Bradybaena similaris]